MKINQVEMVNMDIDGQQEKLWGYVMPNLAYSMILGKPWMEHNDVIHPARQKCLRIGSREYGMLVRASGWYEQGLPTEVQERVLYVSLNQATAEPDMIFLGLLKRAQNTQDSIVGAISIIDITHALETKKAVSRGEDILPSLSIIRRQRLTLGAGDNSHLKCC